MRFISAEARKVFESFLDRAEVVVDANDDIATIIHEDSLFSHFDCITQPGIGIKDFLVAVSRSLTVEEFGLAFILTNRACETGNYPLGCYNAHRLILAALIVSVKINREIRGVMKHFARCTGLEISDLVNMEEKF
eukprot:Hpha_TRINITY_DN24272_c0_g1::TRINITY_DN24272_c0_g1_i1::g.36023::m.36023